jgi:hypothetical protein
MVMDMSQMARGISDMNLSVTDLVATLVQKSKNKKNNPQETSPELDEEVVDEKAPKMEKPKKETGE